MAAAVCHSDPVERKPLYHFRPGSKVLTLAAPGCNLTCGYCQNRRLSQFGRAAGARWEAEPVDVNALVDRAADESAALGFSYSEPGLSAELLLAVAGAIRGRDIPLIWKSNGFLTPRAAHTLAPLLSAANIDLKSAVDEDMRRLSGGGLEPVLETIRIFLEHDVWVEISTPLIPGFNTETSQIRALAGIVASFGNLPWHLLRFVPEFRFAKYSPTPPALLQKARSLGREAGLDYVYVERALGAEGRGTRCPGCDTILQKREIWSATPTLHDPADCPVCGERIPGRWLKETS